MEFRWCVLDICRLSLRQVMKIKNYAVMCRRKGVWFAAGDIVRDLDLDCSTALVRNALKAPGGPVCAAGCGRILRVGGVGCLRREFALCKVEIATPTTAKFGVSILAVLSGSSPSRQVQLQEARAQAGAEQGAEGEPLPVRPGHAGRLARGVPCALRPVDAGDPAPGQRPRAFRRCEKMREIYKPPRQLPC